MTDYIIAAVLSYLLGSIPFGYLLVRTFRGQDVRQSGSGNIGATNVSRTSPALGVLTLILDAMKGGAAVWLAQSLVLAHLPRGTVHVSSDQLSAAFMAAYQVHQRAYLIRVPAALFAVLGHVFPVWLNFSGGKGVATALGAFVMLAPTAVLAMVVVFAIVVLVFRYVSLASVAAAAFFPLLAAFLDGWNEYPLMLGFMVTTSAVIIVKHRENLRRLLAGTEPRLQMRHG